jgi:hypothetical protein
MKNYLLPMDGLELKHNRPITEHFQKKYLRAAQNMQSNLYPDVELIDDEMKLDCKGEWSKLKQTELFKQLKQKQ